MRITFANILGRKVIKNETETSKEVFKVRLEGID